MALIGSVSGSMTGSLTTLGDGTSYLLEGSNVTLTSGANGSITIAASGGGSTFVTGAFHVPSQAEFVTTASVSIAGAKGFTYTADSVGTDTIFFVSGSDAKDSGDAGVAVIGGDFVVSGNVYFSNETPGQDTNFFASGSTESRGSGDRGTAVIGGDFVVSGNTYFLGTAEDTVVGSDVNFFVSGSDSKDSGDKGTAVFDGDAVFSGTIYDGSGNSYSTTAQSPTGTFNVSAPGRFSTTASVAFTGGEGFEQNAFTKGSDTYFWVSGSSYDGDWGDQQGVSVFSGDTLFSASLVIYDNNEGPYHEFSFGALPGGAEDSVFYVSGAVFDGSWGDRGNVIVLGGDTLVSSSLVIYDSIQQDHLFSLGALPEGQDWPGTDAVFFVSGATYSKEEGGENTLAVFGGDLVVSGGLYGGYSDDAAKIEMFVAGDLIALTNTGEYNVGDDVAIFVSGSIYEYDGSQVAGKGVNGTTLVGGDLVVSGNLYGGVVDEFQGSNSTGMVIKAVADVFRYTGGINEHEQFSTPADVNFHVSGSTGLKDDTSKRGTALFGGDVVVSGTIYDGSGNAVGGTAGGSDTQIQYNDGGSFGGTADLTFNDATGDVTVGTSTGDAKLFFRDSGNYIYSNADGDLDIINADGTAANSLVLECTAGGIDINAGGVFTIDGVGASNVTTNGVLTLSGSTGMTLGSSSGDITLSPGGGDVLPDGDNTRNLGASGARWANIYTGDLHLANDRGNWTVVEENDFLSLRNNKNGKTYKLLMEEIIEE